MTAAPDWAAAGFGPAPVAGLTGPFPHRSFLEVWWEHRGGGEALLATGGDALLTLRSEAGRVEFMGEADLTDYHTPLGTAAADLLAGVAASLPAGTRLCFDSLPAEAAGVMTAGLAAAGLAAETRQHEIAAVLDLPTSYDGYLAGVTTKHRHEIRRKRRRFEESLGAPRLVRDPGGFADFVRMHRAAPGEKGEFMTPDLEAFFTDLLSIDGAVLDLVVAGGDRPVAAAFGFVDGPGYYLYNSSFDPAAASVSPGVVMVDLLIRDAIDAGRSRFDFLKGDEEYKFRLGAWARPLYLVEAAR